MNRGKTPSKQDESLIPEEFLGYVDETVTKLKELYQTAVASGFWDCTACREADN